MRNPLGVSVRVYSGSSRVRNGGAAIALRRVGAGISGVEEEGEKGAGRILTTRWSSCGARKRRRGIAAVPASHSGGGVELSLGARSRKSGSGLLDHTRSFDVGL